MPSLCHGLIAVPFWSKTAVRGAVEALRVVFCQGLWIVEKYARLEGLNSVERQLVVVSLVVEVDLAVGWCDVGSIFGLKWLGWLNYRQGLHWICHRLHPT